MPPICQNVFKGGWIWKVFRGLRWDILFTAPQVRSRGQKVGQEATCAQPKREMPNTQRSQCVGAPTTEVLGLGELAPPAMGDRGVSAGRRAQGSFRCRACHPGCGTITAPDNLPFLSAFIGHSGTRAWVFLLCPLFFMAPVVYVPC